MLRTALVLAGVSFVSAVVAPMIYARTPYRRGELDQVEQAVEFDHRHHVRDAGIDCRYCHSSVDNAPQAGIPSTDVCMGCHSQILSDSPMVEPIRRSFFSGKPIAWNRVHDVPDFVYFNHAIHVTNGFTCEHCHGRVDKMARVEQVQTLTMGWCLDCHRNPATFLPGHDDVLRKLTHCSACHR